MRRFTALIATIIAIVATICSACNNRTEELPDNVVDICILGASIAFPENTWFEMACESLNTQGINKARGNGTRIGDDALDWAEGRLFKEGELDRFDVLAIMHCHEAEVCNESKLLTNYNDYTLAAKMDYSQGFDYVIRRYIDLCRALEFDRSSKWYGIEGGKPVKIILCTYWHDARIVYNDSVRQLAKKWSDYTTLCEFDKNIGFTKDEPDPTTGEQISIRYAKNGFGDTEVLYGATYGWHPTRGRNSEIQQRMAEIFADVVKTMEK